MVLSDDCICKFLNCKHTFIHRKVSFRRSKMLPWKLKFIKVLLLWIKGLTSSYSSCIHEYKSWLQRSSLVLSLVSETSWIALNALLLRHFPLLCLFLMGWHVFSLGRTPCTCLSLSISLSVDTMDAHLLNKPSPSWLTGSVNRSYFSCIVEQNPTNRRSEL